MHAALHILPGECCKPHAPAQAPLGGSGASGGLSAGAASSGPGGGLFPGLPGDSGMVLLLLQLLLLLLLLSGACRAFLCLPAGNPGA